MRVDEEANALADRQRYNLHLLTILFLFTTFSGAVRKWVVADATVGNLLLGAQIGLPLIYAGLARTRPLHMTLRTVLIGYSMLLVLMAFNPLGQSLFHGVVGYLLHTGVFIPLLVYVNDREAFPIERLTGLLLLVAGLECALGIVQFNAPPDSFLNKYVREEAAGISASWLTKRVRITGTFSYIGGLTSLFALWGFVLWGMLLTRQSVVKIGLLAGICLITAPMTGSRGLTLTLLAFGGLGLLAGVRSVGSAVALMAVAGLGYVAYNTLAQSSAVVNDAYVGLTTRFETGNQQGETGGRVTGSITEILDFRGKYPLLGTGLGGTYQGTNAILGQSPYVKEYGYYEEEPERVVLEGGFLLFFARLGLWLLLLRFSNIPPFFGLFLVYFHVFHAVTVFNVFTGFYTLVGFVYLDRCYTLRQNPAPVP